MKKILCIVLVFVICCTGLCGCGESSSIDAGVEAKISRQEAWNLFKPKLVSKVSSFWGSSYYDLSKCRYTLDSIEEVGVDYEIKGHYDVYWSYGELANTVGFSGKVNKVVGTVTVDNVYGAY